MRRLVFFVDPPAFCTTVEQLVAPALRGRPVAVAAPGADRATILALSDEARRAGLERGTPVRLARKQCPDLILVPPNPQLYARASRALHEILQTYAPVIEPRGYGHAFLDLSGTERLFGPPIDVAQRIRRESAARLRLPLTIGVAGNKLVSETATTVAPRDLLEVPRGTERPFLSPHPVKLLPDLSPRIRTRLDDYQLDLIGEVAALNERQVTRVLGGEGSILLNQARGIDPRPVLPPALQRRFRTEHTLASDSNDIGQLHNLLRHLAEQLGQRLRRHRLAARRLAVKLVYTDYTEEQRRVPLKADCLDVELWDAARRAFTKANTKRLALRTVVLAVDRLLEAELQLDLWHEPPPAIRREKALQRAVDRIGNRWGGGLVSRGVRANMTTES